MKQRSRHAARVALALTAALAGIVFWSAAAHATDASVPPDRAPGMVTDGPPAPPPAIARSRSGLHPRLVLGTWTSQGPGPIQDGQVENITDFPVSGALHAAAAHPTNADVLYVGSVNGGVWKTTNATATSPSWTPQTDAASSLSISALELDPTDGTSQTLVAGTGRTSSFSRSGGALTGLLRTTNGGSSWSELGALAGKGISGVAPRGSTVVASVNVADSFTCGNLGIFRSTDTGASFTQVTIGSGVPAGISNDLASDPSSTSTLYTSVTFADTCSSGAQANGLFKSTNTGAGWSRVSDAAIEALLISGTTANVEIAVGSSNNVYVGILNNGPTGVQLVGLFRSGNGGTSWVQMDTPKTNENGTDVGLNPTRSQPGDASPGGQGSIHFSIRADPTDANVVYVGGDRQTSQLNGMGVETGVFPNSLGATNYTGRLFRGDASQAPGSQWVHLTHSSSLGPVGGGTASSSAPHADSRELVFDATGDLIETDDGGVYRRTSPQTDTGDWFSMNGNLGVTEFHDIAYDGRSSIISGGTQDVGSAEQTSTASSTWTDVSQGDGGDVAVDDTTVAGQSTRYSSAQNLLVFQRRVYNTANVLQSQSFPALTVLGGGAALERQFVTPVQLNTLDPTRLVIVGDNSIYESLDQGDTITEVGPGQGPNTSPPSFSGQNAVAYGGEMTSIPNEDALYVGVKAQVLVRTAAAPAPIVAAAALPNATPTAPAPTAPAPTPNSFVRDVVLDPDNWMSAFAVDHDQVYRTTNAGGSWTDITGNLAAIGAVDFRTLVFIPGSPDDLLVLGARGKVFVAFSNNVTFWDEMGTGLPDAPVYDLDYDAAIDVLVAGTLGRGAWTFPNASGVVPGPTPSPTATATPTPNLTPICGTTPEAGCRTPAVGAKASLFLNDKAPDTKDQLQWKWLKGAVTTKAEFGDPINVDTYELCIYDGTPTLISRATAPAGGLCKISAPKPCWKANAKGYKYDDKDLTPTGLQQLQLKEGLVAGKAQIQVKGKGMDLDMPVTFPITQPVRVQLKNSSGVCWEAVYSAPASKNIAGPPAQFKDKAD